MARSPLLEGEHSSVTGRTVICSRLARVCFRSSTLGYRLARNVFAGFRAWPINVLRFSLLKGPAFC